MMTLTDLLQAIQNATFCTVVQDFTDLEQSAIPLR